MYNPDIEQFISKLTNESPRLKSYGSLFSGYNTTYPFDGESIKNLATRIAYNFGEILLYERFFLWYSGLFEMYIKTVEVLMQEEGTIPIIHRYFIAIMAVSTIRAPYLLKHLQQIFLIKGGEEAWLLGGLEKVPEKLRKLAKINNILAHQPWNLTTKDLHEILLPTAKNGWNREELVHAALILINYHRLASICESLKLEISGKAVSDNMHISKSAINTEGKTKLYNNLIEMNEESEKEEKQNARKLSGDDPKITILEENKDTHIFDKYISNHCTVYLDYDNYSDTPLSNIVSD